MCEPVTISTTTMYLMGAMAAVGVASSAMQIKQANDAAEAEVEAANNSAMADYAALEEQASQIGDQYVAESAKAKLDAMRLEATIRVSQGESGLSGASSLREIADARQQGSQNLSTLETNYHNILGQNEREKGKISATNLGRANIAESKTIGALGAGLQIVGSGLDGAYAGYTMGTKFSGGRKAPALTPKKSTASLPSGHYYT